MSDRQHIVLQRDRHLKWRAFDPIEMVLMVLCGVAITGFSISVVCDVVTRTLGAPWLWLQEVTSVLFIYGAFIGLAAAQPIQDQLAAELGPNAVGVVEIIRGIK
jgi:TRAP-type C4-dicarboxylate transport system permease small subunit